MSAEKLCFTMQNFLWAIIGTGWADFEGIMIDLENFCEQNTQFSRMGEDEIKGILDKMVIDETLQVSDMSRYSRIL
jgi:hypothetical protein